MAYCLARKLISKYAGLRYSYELENIREYLCKNGAAIERVNILLVEALVCGEDHRFFSHNGVDVLGILRAMRNYFLYGKVEGASTIEQQLVRTLVSDYRLCIGRKTKEVRISICMSLEFDKIFLAKAYLYCAYFGWRMSGVCMAMGRLNISSDRLSNFEAAFVVAMLKYPLPRKPTSARYKLIMDRAKYILRRWKAGRAGAHVGIVDLG